MVTLFNLTQILRIVHISVKLKERIGLIKNCATIKAKP